MRKAGIRLIRTHIPKRTDGSGLVTLQTSEDTYELFNMDRFPMPQELEQYLSSGAGFPVPRRTSSANSTPYRILRSGTVVPTGHKFPSSSFSLGSQHINETLFVLAQLLKDAGGPFAALANKSGNRFRHHLLNNI